MAASLTSAKVRSFARAIQANGGRLWLVGGTVRDRLLGRPVTDIDCEVFGLAPGKIRSIARRFGRVRTVGQAFGILKVVTPTGEFDVAAPRREKKSGPGHRGFLIDIDPRLDPAVAARRRDFTVNAMMADPLTGRLLDPFGGRKDLRERRLRVVDQATFGDDPLRVLRAIQLAGRFALIPDAAARRIMKPLARTLRQLPPDRIRMEWEKLLLFSATPSIGLELAWQLHLISAHELPARRRAWGRVDRLAAAPHSIPGLLAALFLDSGAAAYSRWLYRQGFSEKTVQATATLIAGLRLAGRVSIKLPSAGVVRQVARVIAPGSLAEWWPVAQAVGLDQKILGGWKKVARRVGLWHKFTPIVSGADLIRFGYRPGPRLGKMIGQLEFLAERTGLSRGEIIRGLRTDRFPVAGFRPGRRE